jgi:FSR family fosmidomycin resistance protein-like MFS transporter
MLAALALGHVVVDFYAGMLAPLQEPTLTGHLGRDLAAVAVLLGVFSIAVNVAQPALGLVLRDRAAPWLLVLAPLLAAVMAGLGLTQGYGAALALVLASALGVAVYHPEGAMAVHAAGGRRQHLGMSLFVSGGFFGGACGGLTAGWWAGARGFSGFWLLALPGLAMSLLLFGLGAHRLRTAPAETCAAAHQNLPFGQVWGLAIAFATGITLLFNFLPVAIVHRFGPDAQKWGGTALFALGLSTALGSYAWAGVAARLSTLRVIALELLVSLAPAILLLAALRGAGVAAVLAASALTGLATGGVFPLLVMLARGAAPAGRRLRMGLIIGGTWGSASALYMAAAALTRWWPPHLILTAALPLCLAASAGLALLLARANARRNAAAVA